MNPHFMYSTNGTNDIPKPPLAFPRSASIVRYFLIVMGFLLVCFYIYTIVKSSEDITYWETSIMMIISIILTAILFFIVGRYLTKSMK